MSGSVRVAVRIRPMVESELASGSLQCLEVVSGEPRVLIKGTEKCFAYDYLFDCDSEQIAVYNTAVKHMLENMIKGFNVAVLAYGQTGSGKTFTMGTGESRSTVLEDTGVIPRVVADIFSRMEQSKEYDFCTKVSFIELYEEQVFDLLAQNKEETPLDIREDGNGITISGLTEVPVCTSSDAMDCLVQGSKNRTTGATAMNARSSRSHAILTIYLEFHKKNDRDNIVRAKLHLVDLAGSESAKKTKAEGECFREGVDINKGLLSLGNVLSALRDECSHVPYKDSKLTLLLRDSLGGNAHTLMIACVGPADYNLEETLCTLRYADRARKIKNEPVVNGNPLDEEISLLQHQVQEMQLAVLESKIDMKELDRLHSQARAFRETVGIKTALRERALLAEQAQERLRQLFDDLQQTTGKVMESLNQMMGLSDQNGSNLHTHLQQLQSQVSDFQAMKRTKIRLIEQLVEDSELLQRWKLQRDELSRLKEQGAKRERQFHFMERKLELKQNVVKRKMEEVNKRLKRQKPTASAGRCSCSKSHCVNKLCSCVRSGSKCGENCCCQREKCRN